MGKIMWNVKIDVTVPDARNERNAHEEELENARGKREKIHGTLRRKNVNSNIGMPAIHIF